MIGRTGPTMRESPGGLDSCEKYTIFVYFTCNIMSCTKNISYFLLDVRSNQSRRAWIPWSIDSFEKYSRFVYFTCIISSHIRIYLLFPFGFSGEPARPRVSSLEYRFLWKIHYLRVLYMQYHVMYKNISYFSFGCSGEPVQTCVNSLKYRFLWEIQQIRVLYMHNIISYTHISVISLWIFGRTGPTAREFPGV